MTTEELFKQLLKFIEENTTWESYGYYGPLIYTGPLLTEISRLQCAVCDHSPCDEHTWDCGKYCTGGIKHEESNR